MKSIQKLFFLILLFFLFPLLFSCNSKKEEASTFEQSDDLMHSETLSEEVFKRSWELMEKGQQLADNGSSMEEILKIFPDSTLVQNNETAILFFIKGSAPMLIEMNAKTEGNTENSGNVPLLPQIINPAALLGSFTNANATMATKDKKVNVVGSQRGEEARQIKKAVLISPYMAVFGNSDDYFVVKDILEKNRNYHNNVKVRKSGLKLKDFEDLGNFDIVHISTHGEIFCGNVEIVVEGKIKKADSINKKNVEAFYPQG